MAISKWVHRKADGLFLRGGCYEPEHDPETEGLAEFPDSDPRPNVVMERYDATSPTKRRPATEAEQNAAKPPDLDGAMKNLGQTLTFAQTNGLAKEYPSFWPYLQRANWGGIEWCILNAQSTNKITAAQYNYFRNWATTYRLPITLPAL